MNSTKRISPWAWVPTLYFAQGIPYFIVNNISVLMFAKMGVPNGEMALFTSLLYLPWTIKPFWSPFIDIIKTKRWWIISMQILMSIAFILLTLSIPKPDEATIAAGTTPISMFTITLVLFIITAFASATHDIAALNGLLALDGAALKAAAAGRFGLPALHALPDFPAAAPLPFRDGAALASFYRAQGYGFFAQSSAFAMQDDGTAAPIVHPDTIRLHDLPGYERQKQQILKNPRAFLDGREANNILLYGDKGTGKSSTVKAVVNEYAGRGAM